MSGSTPRTSCIVGPACIGNAVVGSPLAGGVVIIIEGLDVAVLLHAGKGRVEGGFLDYIFLFGNGPGLLGNFIAIGGTFHQKTQDNGVIVPRMTSLLMLIIS